MNSAEIEIKKGIPIPNPVYSVRSPITKILGRMEKGDCIELPYTGEKKKSDLYTKAKTAQVKVTLRTVTDNGLKIIRVWRIA